MRPDRRAGATLLELTVALTISGMVVVAAYGLFRMLLQAEGSSRHARRVVLTTAGPRILLAQWFRSIVTGRGAMVDRLVRRDGPVPLDELTFAVTDGGPLFVGPRIIHLWIDDDPETPLSGLLAEVTLRDLLGARPETLMVVPDAVGLTVRLGQFSGSGIGWDEEPVRGGLGPPAVVAVELVSGEPEQGMVDDELLRLPIIAPVGGASWR